MASGTATRVRLNVQKPTPCPWLSTVNLMVLCSSTQSQAIRPKSPRTTLQKLILWILKCLRKPKGLRTARRLGSSTSWPWNLPQSYPSSDRLMLAKDRRVNSKKTVQKQPLLLWSDSFQQKRQRNQMGKQESLPSTTRDSQTPTSNANGFTASHRQ